MQYRVTTPIGGYMVMEKHGIVDMHNGKVVGCKMVEGGIMIIFKTDRID